MKDYNKTGEWCRLIFFNKIELCLKYNFSIREIDTFMFGFKLRQGIAIGVLGLIIELNYGGKPMI